MREKWVPLVEFPNYLVSTDGRIMNDWGDRIKQPSKNQMGITIVNLHKEGKQHVRSVAVLVANTFLYNSDIPQHFDTPIHLNGDRTDCRVENLELRPRWFAVRYHQQFNEQERATRFGFKSPVLLIETEEVFPTSWEAAIKYGLLDHEIFVATLNATYVFPHRYHFEVIDEEQDQPYTNARTIRGI